MSTEAQPTLRQRVSKAAKMNQEPRDRMWGVIIVFGILILALGGIAIEARLFLAEGHTLGYQRGAVDCLSLMVDNDREFKMPDYCLNPNVVVYYPAPVCDQYFDGDARCGREEAR
jgi:hypothetical protein